MGYYGIRISLPTLRGHHNILGYIMFVNSTTHTRYGWILSMRSWNLGEKEIDPSWLKYITTLIRQQIYEQSIEYECCMGSSISVTLQLRMDGSWIRSFWWARPSRVLETIMSGPPNIMFHQQIIHRGDGPWNSCSQRTSNCASNAEWIDKCHKTG